MERSWLWTYYAIFIVNVILLTANLANCFVWYGDRRHFLNSLDPEKIHKVHHKQADKSKHSSQPLYTFWRRRRYSLSPTLPNYLIEDGRLSTLKKIEQLLKDKIRIHSNEVLAKSDVYSKSTVPYYKKYHEFLPAHTENITKSFQKISDLGNIYFNDERPLHKSFNFNPRFNGQGKIKNNYDTEESSDNWPYLESSVIEKHLPEGGIDNSQGLKNYQGFPSIPISYIPEQTSEPRNLVSEFTDDSLFGQSKFLNSEKDLFLTSPPLNDMFDRQTGLSSGFETLGLAGPQIQSDEGFAGSEFTNAGASQSGGPTNGEFFGGSFVDTSGSWGSITGSDDTGSARVSFGNTGADSGFTDNGFSDIEFTHSGSTSRTSQTAIESSASSWSGGGFGEFGQSNGPTTGGAGFVNDGSQCEGIDTRTCLTDAQCVCYGFYHCSNSLCTVIGSAASGTPTTQDDTWHEVPMEAFPRR
ncbi:uncharacterized protein LOC126828716 [Patella vulgata]|uniref:uncharacterized protein LOC126828716 n=1 Tax=Patella vulgata TaxID=6465 RepID=UPI0024A8B391|nr:uncharacterized protein LOC126828716 [Patella vulgata]XP_050414635.2 uncharacterized protein LOC126828716 [Patella vulgata]XP_050414636.2 uncharacterized protein LOC126828716 [Patella vulgata]XP_050414637.2 uncharacterized protein LOC126828716 [Patella vulgata]XP_050414638.2 uncharacterized protein LOC126828716 [Patella vulgata]